ncbi:MAG: peptidylprolyl isomerase [Planctomycetaceae bacterium]|nr:peptidylprolyl isomerase [Planctomycetaceae bacterium]
MSHPQATIETNHGTITVELWEDVAPNHVQNMLELGEKGFYDGLGFHRILPGFVIQGGCPNTREGAAGMPGTGGPGHQLKAEFNDRAHEKGVLSMARSGDPDSAGSQFFICLGRDKCQHLDGEYTAFGKVIDGLDVVDAIAAIDIDPHSGAPTGEMPRMVGGIKPISAE